MPSHAPAILIPLLRQPVMAEDLGIEVENFKRGMVDMGFGAFEEKEAVVIDGFFAAV